MGSWENQILKSFHRLYGLVICAVLVDANKTRHLSAVVKSIADEKSNAEKVEKVS